MSLGVETICKACSTQFDTKYCPNCGTSAQSRAIDRAFVVDEIKRDLIHFEDDYFFTIKELFLHPGHALRRYVDGDRSRYYRPIKFLLLSSVVYALLSSWLGHEEIQGTSENNFDAIFQWIEAHYNYTNLFGIFVVALFLTWFFRKKGYRYYENVILLSYFTGFEMLIDGFFVVITYLTKVEEIDDYSTIVSIFYVVWAVVQTHNTNHWWAYLKSFFAQFLGVIAVLLAAFLLALILDALHIRLT